MPIDFVSLFSVLNAANSRFVLVGGLAVVLHGFDRLTSDADIIIDLAADNTRITMTALIAAGYQSLAPVDPMQFSDPQVREHWSTQKGMTVFSMWDRSNVRPNVDLFVSSPIPFSDLYEKSVLFHLHGAAVRVASLEHLLDMKRIAGRERDWADIRLIESRLAKDRE
jgi:hypothetical protein